MSSGLFPAVRHALETVMVREPLLLPASVEVVAQAGTMRSYSPCDLDLSALSKHR